jgi:hypothetical protein
VCADCHVPLKSSAHVREGGAPPAPPFFVECRNREAPSKQHNVGSLKSLVRAFRRPGLSPTVSVRRRCTTCTWILICFVRYGDQGFTCEEGRRTSCQIGRMAFTHHLGITPRVRHCVGVFDRGPERSDRANYYILSVACRRAFRERNIDELDRKDPRWPVHCVHCGRRHWFCDLNLRRSSTTYIFRKFTRELGSRANGSSISAIPFPPFNASSMIFTIFCWH